MDKIPKTFALAIALIVITACSYDNMADLLIPKDESKFAQDYLTKLRAKDFQYIRSFLSPDTLAEVNDETLYEVAGYFRTGEPISEKIVGSDVYQSGDYWEGNFTFEYEFESGWNIASVAVVRVGDRHEVANFSVYQTDTSLAELNAFTLKGKSSFQYFFLITTIMVFLFILATVYACARTPISNRKWLWIIFILLGVGVARIDWTTGQYAVQLLGIQLFGASAIAAGPYAPWVISYSVPLGAILFWLKRDQFLATRCPVPLAPPVAPANSPSALTMLSRILGQTIAVFVLHYRALFHVCLPTAPLLVAANFAVNWLANSESSPPVGVELIVMALAILASIALSTLLIVGIHRYIVFGEVAAPAWAAREWRLLKHMLVTAWWGIFSIVSLGLFIIGSIEESPYLGAAVGLVTLLGLGFLASRLVLMFPSIAVDKPLTVSEALAATRSRRGVIFTATLAVPIPLAIVFGLFEIGEPWYPSLIAKAFLDIGGFIFGIVMVSVIYRNVFETPDFHHASRQ